MIIFTRAAQMLAEADTIQKTKELKSLALTAAEWAKRKGMGEEAVHLAQSYALEAERKMGEMLRDTERNKGAKGSIVTSTHREPVKDNTPTLAALGVSKKESSRAQALAALPRATFEQIKTGDKTRVEVAREIKRDEVKKKVAEFPSDKYRIVYADPPWKYGDQLTENYGSTKFHYPSMTISELCALPVKDLAEENAVLFLWVTSPILPEAFDVIRAWGFAYKSSFVWDKIKHNMGHYNSVRHEFLLICTRGSCLPDSRKLTDSVQSIERSEKHSQKPVEFRAIIEEMYTVGKKIELFAREKTAGWDTWGNESG